jgi:hypothetical protein
MSDSSEFSSFWGENAALAGTIIYRENQSAVDYSNLLLIDGSILQSNVLFKSANSATFPIVYNSSSTSRSELLDFLQLKILT